MAMGFSIHGAAIRHPFICSTSLCLSSFHRGAISGFARGPHVHPPLCRKEVDFIALKQRNKVNIIVQKVLQDHQNGRIPLTDDYPKIGRGAADLVHLDGREDDHPNNCQDAISQDLSSGEKCSILLSQPKKLPFDSQESEGSLPAGDENVCDKATCPGNSKKSQPVKKGTNKVVNREQLACIYDEVLVVDNISRTKQVVWLLTTEYKHFFHACDTEVANIDVKVDTPVAHGEIICFSIYSGPQANFGNGRSCVWVDVLDGEKDVLKEFVPFFEDSSIKKVVWHNYSFVSHALRNHGIKLSGFHADTMHLARLWDSSRRVNGGYSLEALTSDPNVMSSKRFHVDDGLTMAKISMKSIFGKKKLKKDGSEGKLIALAPTDELQREERKLWVCYSALDSISTYKLFDNLKAKLMHMQWSLDGVTGRTMYDFYEEYWRPFGSLLVQMESEGMLVDREYLSEVEKLAIAEKEIAADKFRKWATKYCPDAKYMNVGSNVQICQLFFGSTLNRKDQNECLPDSKSFKVLNTENAIEKGKKSLSKYRTIELHNICIKKLQTQLYTASGWPSVSGDSLKVLAGMVSLNQTSDDQNLTEDVAEVADICTDEDTSASGTAYEAFGEGKDGREACQAIAALCEVSSIDSLISNFILPLQGNYISCVSGRIHYSLNINTETGRLSARRPSLQNQPALEKDRYKIRQAFIAEPGKSLIVADYGQLELRILAHLANCKSMLAAFRAGGDFHSRTAMDMYAHVCKAVEEIRVLLEWHPQLGKHEPPVPLLKDVFAAERRRAKILNFSIAYGKTPIGLSRDWKVSVEEAKKTVDLWYKERQEVLLWQEKQKNKARTEGRVWTLLGRSRCFPSLDHASIAQRGHIERAAINTPVQGSAADVAMCAMLKIDRNIRLKELGWKLVLQVHDEMILEGPTVSAELAKAIVVECMSKPFYGTNFLKVDLVVDAKCAQNWYAAK
ncbi:hypothetical protein OPV22_021549 [Ensete ventricosum]|uniref:DNA-directed DNA polymerase n=1 Tax=Ensete ventricosum TaxID=4639 RepID=A0AAV8QHD6_ENSVE|nr:hypothetical protein OPV22_021549 [Ensete ventricosum]